LLSGGALEGGDAPGVELGDQLAVAAERDCPDARLAVDIVHRAHHSRVAAISRRAIMTNKGSARSFAESSPLSLAHRPGSLRVSAISRAAYSPTMSGKAGSMSRCFITGSFFGFPGHA